MYNSTILDHLENPRNAGEMADASAMGEASNPVCGDRLFLYLKTEGDRIVGASFTVKGCPPSIAAGSVLSEMLIGRTVAEARSLKPKDVTTALEPLPRNKEHCSILAIDALRAALAQIKDNVV